MGGAGRPLETTALLTTEANELVRPVHDRMPVIVEPANFALWLDPKMQDAAKMQPLLRPYPAERMTSVTVGPRVNRADYDGAECLEPAA